MQIGIGIGVDMLRPQGGGGGNTVPVMVWAGQSQIGGARSVKADITGYPALDTDANAFIWDVPSQAIVTLVPGSAELQPSLALMDPAYTDTVGPLGEFDRFFRRDNPSTPIYHFKYAVGGSRFSDAGSLGRDANWANVAGGCRDAMLAEWTAFVAALAADGKSPRVTWMATDLGYSSGTDSTEATNYESDMTALIAWWRTNIIGASTRLTIARPCSTIAGFGFLSTIRTAQANIKAAAPALIDQLSTDDFQLVVDNVHFSAASHMTHGERLYCHFAQRWYPMRDVLNGSAIYPTDYYRGGDLRNTYIGADKTGNISVLWDGIRGRTGSITFTQTNNANRPALKTETLNGMSGIRTAEFTGSPRRMTRSAGRMAGTTPFGLVIAARIATPSGPSCLMGEGLSSDGNPFVQFRTDTDGLFESLSRDSTGAIITGPTDWSAAAAAGDVMRTYIVGCDSAGNITPQTDGTIGGGHATEIDTLGSTNRVSIGAFSANATLYYANADYAEFWWTNIAPDTTYRTQVRAYTQWRWGAA